MIALHKCITVMPFQCNHIGNNLISIINAITLKMLFLAVKTYINGNLAFQAASENKFSKTRKFKYGAILVFITNRTPWNISCFPWFCFAI